MIEFSDFECPSCQRAAGYMKPILAAHGDKVRYIRYDMPLMTIHPWAFAAAIAGRAVWHQKPDLFWKYKEQIYENQDKLSAFTIDEFARGFATDHELDMKKYDADVQSPELRAEIVNGAGTRSRTTSAPRRRTSSTAHSSKPGDGGKGLADYVNKAAEVGAGTLHAPPDEIEEVLEDPPGQSPDLVLAVAIKVRGIAACRGTRRSALPVDRRFSSASIGTSKTSSTSLACIT